MKKDEPWPQRQFQAPPRKFLWYCYPHDRSEVEKSCGECRGECPGASKNK